MDQSQQGGKGYQPNLWPARMDSPMDRRKFLISGGSALAAAGLLVACGGSSGGAGTTGGGGGGSDVTYGYSQPYAEVPVVATVKSIVSHAAEEKNWNVLLDETRGGDLQSQVSVLDTWITQKITAITVYPPEPSALEPSAQRALDAGVIWTTYSETMKQGAGGVLFPAQLFGEIAGKSVVDWINANDPEAEVLILEFQGPAQRERVSIPEEMIEQQTKAKIVAKQMAVDEVKGLQVAEDVLQAHPNVSVVVGFNDDGALGAAEAFRKAGTKDPSEVFILGQDGAERALIALGESGSYYNASVALNLGELGEVLVGVVNEAIEAGWKDGDPQNYAEVSPTLLERGDTQKIKQYLSTYKENGA